MIRSERASERGAVAVEMALVLPILVLILGGIIDFGFAFNAQVSLTHAAREGVRVEAIGSGDGETRARAAYTAIGTIGPVETDVDACDGSGGDARVTIADTYSFFILPFNNRYLQGQAVMRCGG